jgi:pimeloyl-ACP methyl ester carboxylesterase
MWVTAMDRQKMKSYKYTSFDGVNLAVHEMGEGRALVLIHGYFSDADTNWIKFGHAARLADAGYRVIMPDLRGHGHSDKPHDLAYYTPDVLADDQFALIAHLGLTDFDIGGYSLGGRTVVRMLALGCVPGKAIISGMGLQGTLDTKRREKHFRNILTNLGKHERGSPEFMAEAFLKTAGGDPLAMLGILDTFVDTPMDVLAGLKTQIAVICGDDDQDNGSATQLADVLPHGRLINIPGNHMSAVTKPELGEAIRAFLDEGR